MRQQRFVKAVVYFVVIGMVLALGVGMISALFS